MIQIRTPLLFILAEFYNSNTFLVIGKLRCLFLLSEWSTWYVLHKNFITFELLLSNFYFCNVRLQFFLLKNKFVCSFSFPFLAMRLWIWSLSSWSTSCIKLCKTFYIFTYNFVAKKNNTYKGDYRYGWAILKSNFLLHNVHAPFWVLLGFGQNSLVWCSYNQVSNSIPSEFMNENLVSYECDQ